METEEDYYKILGIEDITSTKDQISKAFKKMCLIWHPDKRRDDPTAPEKFHKIHKAYEILSDDKAREAYDNVVRAKIARKKRVNEMDSKRRKMKEDLESREASFKKQKDDEVSAKEKLKAEIERLRRDGFNMAQKMSQEKKDSDQAKQATDGVVGGTLRVTWNNKKGEYSRERLTQIFKLFGDIDYVVINSNPEKKKKTGSALVAFKNPASALLAARQTLGDADNLLAVSFIGPIPSETSTTSSAAKFYSVSSSTFPYSTPTSSVPSKSVSLQEHEDFEDKMFKKMMEAAAKQKQQTQQNV